MDGVGGVEGVGGVGGVGGVEGVGGVDGEAVMEDGIAESRAGALCVGSVDGAPGSGPCTVPESDGTMEQWCRPGTRIELCDAMHFLCENM